MSQPPATPPLRPRAPVDWGLRLLPRGRRAALTALTAYCRELQAVADGPVPLAEKRGRLAAWRRELDALYAGLPATGLSLALLDPIRRYDLPRDELEEIVKGMEMDAAGIMLAPLLCDLRLYCRRVAGAVAILGLGILGDRSRPAGCFGLVLGEAMQMTVILRDLADDAALGRLYLPRETLAEAGIVAASPAEVLGHDALPWVCDSLAALAASRFEEARLMLPELRPTAAQGAGVMLEAHRRLLDRLTARGWRDLDQRPALGRLELIGLSLRHRVFGAA
ncbi:squalene/phytoene synthase family protein [Caenispirillum bisanense]|uniref:Phytoene synthase n=1 Tax=Caenispirillum bisanense TaxID=414052 RepID=A0A286GEP0_9PROT|nr:squalene/phytoene synthase family protein [Caenispirillum bisanense]SOD93995.1 phytoene synthase [Caenispirillum bisanense]